MAQIWHCSAHFFPLQVGEIGFSGIGQVSLCGLAPLLNILVSNTMFWVWDHFQKHQINLEVRNDFTPWSPPWPPTAPPTCSWPSGRSKTSENGSKSFPIPQNISFDTRTMYLACSEAELLPKLKFNFLKSFLTSYSPSTQFLSYRSFWGLWKWSQMIPHTPKHWFCHQNPCL